MHVFMKDPYRDLATSQKVNEPNNEHLCTIDHLVHGGVETNSIDYSDVKISSNLWFCKSPATDLYEWN